MVRAQPRRARPQPVPRRHNRQAYGDRLLFGGSDKRSSMHELLLLAKSSLSPFSR